jgi:MscS family membrane protein
MKKLLLVLLIAAAFVASLAQNPAVNAAQGPRELVLDFIAAFAKGEDLSPYIVKSSDPALDLQLAQTLAQELEAKQAAALDAFAAIPEQVEESLVVSPLLTQVGFEIIREENGQWKFKLSRNVSTLLPPATAKAVMRKAVQWPLVLLLAAAGILVGWLVHWPLRRLLKRFDQDGTRLTGRARRFLAWGIGLGVSSHVFAVALAWLPHVGRLPDGFYIVLRVLTSTGLVLAGWGIWDFVCSVAGAKVDEKGGPGSRLLVPIMQKFGQAIIFLAVLYALVLAFGFNPGGLLAGLGLTTALAALAAKDSVENFVGTLTILFERPFVIGDWIKVGDVEGIVEEIGLRTTKIRSFSDSLISMPNIKVVAQPVENMGKRRLRPFKLTFPVIGSHTQVQAFAESARGIVQSTEGVAQDKSHAAVAGLDAGKPQMTLSLFIAVDSYAEELKLREGLMLKLLESAEQQGVKLYFEMVLP